MPLHGKATVKFSSSRWTAPVPGRSKVNLRDARLVKSHRRPKSAFLLSISRVAIPTAAPSGDVLPLVGGLSGRLLITGLLRNKSKKLYQAENMPSHGKEMVKFSPTNLNGWGEAPDEPASVGLVRRLTPCAPPATTLSASNGDFRCLGKCAWPPAV
jgi:hypothetical protein